MWEDNKGSTFSLQEELLWIMDSYFGQKWWFNVKTPEWRFKIKPQTQCFSLYKVLIDGLEWCGLLWSFYQLFGLRRHPFTDPLVSKWWNATFLQMLRWMIKQAKKTKTLRLTLGTDVVKNKILEGSNFAALHSDICVAVLRVNVDGSGPVSGRVYRSVLRGDGLHANQLTTRLPLNNHRPQIRSEDAIERWACRERERWRDAAVHRGSVDGCDGACL